MELSLGTQEMFGAGKNTNASPPPPATSFAFHLRCSLLCVERGNPCVVVPRAFAEFATLETFWEIVGSPKAWGPLPLRKDTFPRKMLYHTSRGRLTTRIWSSSKGSPILFLGRRHSLSPKTKQDESRAALPLVVSGLLPLLLGKLRQEDPSLLLGGP